MRLCRCLSALDYPGTWCCMHDSALGRGSILAIAQLQSLWCFSDHHLRLFPLRHRLTRIKLQNVAYLIHRIVPSVNPPWQIRHDMWQALPRRFQTRDCATRLDCSRVELLVVREPISQREQLVDPIPNIAAPPLFQLEQPRRLQSANRAHLGR
jgi:hypothetical protein